MTRTKSTFSRLWDRLTGQGGAGDHSTGSTSRGDKTPGEIEELLNHNGLLRSACEVMAEDITRAWRTLPKDAKAWIDAEEKFSARPIVEQALIFTESYGGCFVIPRYPADKVTKDKLAAPFQKQPKGTLLGFDIFAPHELKIPTSSQVKINPVSRLPAVFELPTENGTSHDKLLIDGSWLLPVRGALRFGRTTKNHATLGNCQNLLGQSKVDIIFNDFERLAGGLQNLSHLLNKANIDVLKIQGLAAALKGCANTDEMQKAIQNLLQTATFTIQGANTYQPMVIDADENLERHNIGSSNTVPIVEQFLAVFVAVTRIPRTRLIGEQSKGLNNGGDADMSIYYDRCGSIRERRATGLINWMDQLIGHDQGIAPVAWEYGALWQMSAKEKAEIEAKQAETDTKYNSMDIPFMTSRIAQRLAANATYEFSEAELAAIRETDGAIDDDLDDDTSEDPATGQEV